MPFAKPRQLSGLQAEPSRPKPAAESLVKDPCITEDPPRPENDQKAAADAVPSAPVARPAFKSLHNVHVGSVSLPKSLPKPSIKSPATAAGPAAPAASSAARMVTGKAYTVLYIKKDQMAKVSDSLDLCLGPGPTCQKGPIRPNVRLCVGNECLQRWMIARFTPCNFL